MCTNFYDENAKKFISETVHVDMSHEYERFLANLPSGGSILDAGSGSGRDALAFKELGFDVQAFDRSREMVSATRALARVPTFQMSFAEFQSTDRFDGIWACASLLHVKRVELPDALERLTASLKPKGVIYCSFKLGKDERVKDGRHFSDMNPELMAMSTDRVSGLTLNSHWISNDRRLERKHEQWFNCILVIDKV